MSEDNCTTCQVCYQCQGQEQVMGRGCGNCYTCQAGYAGPEQGGPPPANALSFNVALPGDLGPPGPQNRQPRPVFNWELEDLNAKLDQMLVLIKNLVDALAPLAGEQDEKDWE